MYQSQFIGKKIFIKEVKEPIWTNIIAKDIKESYGIIGVNHLLYGTPIEKSLYLEFNKQDKFFEVYMKYIEYLWSIADDVDFSKIPIDHEEVII